MDNYLDKCKSIYKTMGVFSILICALIFATPAGASPRENLTTSLTTAAPVQLAYYYRGGHHRYHHWNRWNRHHWNRWHRGYHRHHHWRR